MAWKLHWLLIEVWEEINMGQIRGIEQELTGLEKYIYKDNN